MKKLFYSSFLFPIVFSIFISIFFIPCFQTISAQTKSGEKMVYTSTLSNIPQKSTSFLWPTPGYTHITSDFGYRRAPANGAARYHGGIDIGVPEGHAIQSIQDGIVSYVGWYGANGYTVILTHDEHYQSIYGHVSPNFLVSTGEKVYKGQTIAAVGPKYISKTSYTSYTDSTGKCTNGATTGPHLHLAITKDKQKIDPKTLFSI